MRTIKAAVLYDYNTPIDETLSDRKQHGRKTRSWKADDGQPGTLAYRYVARHRYDHQGEHGMATFRCMFCLAYSGITKERNNEDGAPQSEVVWHRSSAPGVSGARERN